MHQDQESQYQPVSYYELMGLSPTASRQIIKQKYRLLCLIWNSEAASKWAQTDDLSYCAEIINKISEAYQVLENPHTRKIYDSLPANQAVTSADQHFRIIWDHLTTKYQQQLSNLRAIYPTIKKQQVGNVDSGWGLSQGVLYTIFQRVQYKELARLNRVSKESLSAVTAVVEKDLQDYCDFINRQVQEFSELTDQNTLTLNKLRQHWQHGDVQLQRLIACRTNSSNKDLKKWQQAFLKTVDDPLQNDYLNNPYLKDLIILILYQANWFKARELVKVNYETITEFHDPSAISLYMYILGFRVFKDHRDIGELFAKIWRKEYFAKKIPENLRSTLNEIFPHDGDSHNENHVKATRIIDNLTRLLLSFYKNTETVFPLIIKTVLLNADSYDIERVAKIPGANFLRFMLSLDDTSLSSIIKYVGDIKSRHLNQRYWENLYRQISRMSLEEMLSYLPVMENTGATNDYEENDLEKHGANLNRLLLLQEEFTELPLEFIQERIKRLAASHDTKINLNCLRLLLNARVKFITPDLIYSIFSKDRMHYDKKGNGDEYRSNLETFTLYLSEECINYLTDPHNFTDENQSVTIAKFLASDQLDGNKLGKLFDLCMYLINQNRLSLLIDKLLYVSDLFNIDLEHLKRFEEILKILPAENITRVVLLRLINLTRFNSLNDYRIYLDVNDIVIPSFAQLGLFIVTPSENVLASKACLQLLKTTGLTDFNFCSSLEFNCVSLISYLEGMFRQHHEHFDSLLSLVQGTFRNKQEEQLPDLIRQFLSNLLYRSNNKAKRRIEDPEQPPLPKLICQQDHDDSERNVDRSGDEDDSSCSNKSR